LVFDVPAKLAARMRVYSKGHGRKTDTEDAVSFGLAALNSGSVASVRADDTLVSLRLLCDRRDELLALRVQAVCRLHRLLAELTPGGTHRGLRTSRSSDDHRRRRAPTSSDHRRRGAPVSASRSTRTMRL
jgi:hypothetical protein